LQGERKDAPTVMTETKIGETKVEKPKVEKTKIEEPKIEEPKIEEKKVEETLIKEIRVGEKAEPYSYMRKNKNKRKRDDQLLQEVMAEPTIPKKREVKADYKLPANILFMPN